jgi:putative heme iron utilization protein
MSDTLLVPDSKIVADALAFRIGFSCLILGTVNNSGSPHTSYAPYITAGGRFYIYVSGLAEHSNSLQNGKASVLFIENEQQSKNLFARKRLSLNCKVITIQRNQDNYHHLLDTLQDNHGPTVKLLRTLADFVLFELSPERAIFITGFGAAYDVSASLEQLMQTSST